MSAQKSSSKPYGDSNEVVASCSSGNSSSNNILISNTSTRMNSSAQGIKMNPPSNYQYNHPPSTEAGGPPSLQSEDDGMGQLANPIRTWPRVHPSRGQIRSCIEFSPSTSSSSVIASVPTSIRNPDGHPIRNVYTSSNRSQYRFEDSPCSTRASRSSSTHLLDPTGVTLINSSGPSSSLIDPSRRQSFSHIPSRPVPPPPPSTSSAVDIESLSHYLGLTHLNLGLTTSFDFNTTPGGDDDPHSCASSANSITSAPMDHDSLEDLHRQQDAEFQELLADFADQQHELEASRKPPNSSSNNSLSLSSIVSNEDTSESSCGTLSEIFESLSRFSEHCLASVEALSSPMYLNSSSFTTTPTGPADNFGFDFDYGGEMMRRDEFLPIRREDYMEDHHRVRQREERQPIRRRHSSAIEGLRYHDNNVRPEELPSSSSSGGAHRCHNNHQSRARDEFFRSILESGVEHLEGSEAGAGGGGGGRSRHSGQGNESQEEEEEGGGGGGAVSCGGGSGGSSSRHGSKNMSLDNMLGMELEIFSAGLEVPSSSMERRGPSGENSIVAALAFLRESSGGSNSTGPLVTALEWQERCVELEVALQRFGEQAARVRLILRDKKLKMMENNPCRKWITTNQDEFKDPPTVKINRYLESEEMARYQDCMRKGPEADEEMRDFARHNLCCYEQCENREPVTVPQDYHLSEEAKCKPSWCRCLATGNPNCYDNVQEEAKTEALCQCKKCYNQMEPKPETSRQKIYSTTNFIDYRDPSFPYITNKMAIKTQLDDKFWAYKNKVDAIDAAKEPKITPAPSEPIDRVDPNCLGLYENLPEAKLKRGWKPDERWWREPTDECRKGIVKKYILTTTYREMNKDGAPLPLAVREIPDSCMERPPGDLLARPAEYAPKAMMYLGDVFEKWDRPQARRNAGRRDTMHNRPDLGCDAYFQEHKLCRAKFARCPEGHDVPNKENLKLVRTNMLRQPYDRMIPGYGGYECFVTPPVCKIKKIRNPFDPYSGMSDYQANYLMHPVELYR